LPNITESPKLLQRPGAIVKRLPGDFAIQPQARDKVGRGLIRFVIVLVSQLPAQVAHELVVEQRIVHAPNGQRPVFSAVLKDNLVDAFHVIRFLATDVKTPLDSLNFQLYNAVVLRGIDGHVLHAEQVGIRFFGIDVHQLFADLLGNALASLAVMLAEECDVFVPCHGVPPLLQLSALNPNSTDPT